MPQAAPRPDPHPGPSPEPIDEDLGLRPELLACWALRRAHGGGLAKSGYQYVDHGRLQLSHLTQILDELTDAGLLVLTDADPSGLRRVNLTQTGHAHYTQLTTHRVTRSVPEPPSPHRPRLAAGRAAPTPLLLPAASRIQATPSHRRPDGPPGTWPRRTTGGRLAMRSSAGVPTPPSSSPPARYAPTVRATTAEAAQ